MIGQKITLNEVEQKICVALAERRYKSNRASGVPNKKIGNQSNAFTDLEGIAAEMAMCKLFGIYPTQVLDPTPRSSLKGEEVGGDIPIKGHSVDVKATKYDDGRLLAAKWKDGVDCYALLTGIFPNYTFRGFMEAKELLQKYRLGNLGYGPTYVAHQDELKEFEELIFDA